MVNNCMQIPGATPYDTSHVLPGANTESMLVVLERFHHQLQRILKINM